MADAVAAWPVLGHESREWMSTMPDLMSNRQRARHSGPYHAAMVPQIADLPVHLPGHLAADAEGAATEIARFDEYVTHRFGPADIAPLTVLLRSESAASSQIEHLTVGAQQLALAELGEPATANAALVAGNVAAMRAAVALAEQINPQSLLAMHRALLHGTSPEHAGRWRRQQVWVGGTPYGPHLAAFVPPHHSHVEQAIDDLVRFAARDDVPALTQAAIAHAQFETIHPFTDGNGRTGRALIHAMLQRGQLTRRATVPVSAGLLADVESYFEALTAYRAGQVAPIVERTVDAAYLAIVNGRRLVDDLAELREGWRDRIRARRDAAAWRLRDLVISQPVVSAAFVAERLKVSLPAAQVAIDTLVDARALTAVSAARRNRVWQADEVLAALNDFAARAGRRGPG